jgi:2-polyprenyl-3-methyl-5-hydroxy-6-metoxy-1,4-benzoquinol methylase
MLQASHRLEEDMGTDRGTIDEEQVAELLGRSGDLFTGCERFFRPGYAANLVTSWIPALEGVRAKLEAGAQVADVGCRHGASPLSMAHAYPNSSVVGFDDHQPSVRHAQQVAADAGLAEHCRFEVATASAYPGASYDLVTIFDALHDMGDPVGAAVHIRQSLAPDGTLLLVEPYGGEQGLRQQVASAAGFGHFRRVAQTPFNLVYEARP